jgi:hypothetical protein
LLGGKTDLGRVIERGRRRNGFRVMTKKHVTGLSRGDGPEWEG